jgi:hypothetical protein
MTIIEAILDSSLFKAWFTGSTWRVWFVFLKALFALPMDEDEVIFYARHTKRQLAPSKPFKEAWVAVGRRGGKSIMAALLGVFVACFRDYSKYLKPGEFGTVMILAADRRQAPHDSSIRERLPRDSAS